VACPDRAARHRSSGRAVGRRARGGVRWVAELRFIGSPSDPARGTYEATTERAASMRASRPYAPGVRTRLAGGWRSLLGLNQARLPQPPSQQRPTSTVGAVVTVSLVGRHLLPLHRQGARRLRPRCGAERKVTLDAEPYARWRTSKAVPKQGG
jgi:hypothetical protein